MSLAIQSHPHASPAVLLASAVEQAGGTAVFNHSYWNRVAFGPEGHPSSMSLNTILQGISRQLYVASMFAQYPIHAFVLYAGQLVRVPPFSSVPGTGDMDPVCVMMYVVIDPPTKALRYHAISIRFGADAANEDETNRVVLVSSTDMQRAVDGMRQLQRATSAKRMCPPTPLQ